MARPKVDESKRKIYGYRMRMNFDEKTLLNRLAVKTGKKKSEIIVEALKKYERGL